MRWNRYRPLNSGRNLRKLGMAFSVLGFIAIMLTLAELDM